MAGVSCAISRLFGFCCLICCICTYILLIHFVSFRHEVDVAELPCCGRYWWPLLWNTLLINLFVVQHTIMSSSAWKKAMSFVQIGETLCQQLYVISSCACLLLLFAYFEPMPGPYLWNFDVKYHQILGIVFMLFHTVMWLLISIAGCLHQPLRLVGLAESGSSYKNFSPPNIQPMHLGMSLFVAILWLQMTMTVERFLVAIILTLYILIGHRYSSVAVTIKDKE